MNGRTTRTAVRWTALSTAARAIIALVQTMVLARILESSAFGSIAVAIAVLGLLGLFADLGISSSYINLPMPDDRERSDLFWLTVGLGAASTLFALLIAPAIAWWAGDPGLTALLSIGGCTLLFNAGVASLKAHAERHLNFRPLAIAELAGGCIGFLASISTAILDCGAKSVMYGLLAASISQAVLTATLTAGQWRPYWRVRHGNVTAHIRMGCSIATGNLINHFNSSLDILLSSRLVPVDALGLYSLPRQLTLQIQGVLNPIASRVGFPMVVAVQADRAEVGRRFLQTVRIVAAANALPYGCLVIFGGALAEVLLGEKWGASGPLLQVLGAWGYCRSVQNPNGILLLGTGRARRALVWNLIVSAALVPGLALGATQGMKGVAWVMLGLSIALLFPAWKLVVRQACDVGRPEYLDAILRPAALSGVAGILAYFASMSIGSAMAKLAAGLLVHGVIYFVLSLRFNRTVREIAPEAFRRLFM